MSSHFRYTTLGIGHQSGVTTTYYANDVHSYGGTDFSALGTPTRDNAVMIAANIIYKF